MPILNPILTPDPAVNPDPDPDPGRCPDPDPDHCADPNPDRMNLTLALALASHGLLQGGLEEHGFLNVFLIRGQHQT